MNILKNAVLCVREKLVLKIRIFIVEIFTLCFRMEPRYFPNGNK